MCQIEQKSVEDNKKKTTSISRNLMSLLLQLSTVLSFWTTKKEKS